MKRICIQETVQHLQFPSSFYHVTLIALVERLDILMASKAAENTGVRNDFVSVWDELLRQNLIDKLKYKIIILQL